MRRFLRFFIAFCCIFTLVTSVAYAAGTTVATNPTETLITGILALVMPAVAGFLLTAGLKSLVPWVDKQPAILQQLVVFIFAAITTWITSKTGVAFPATVSGLDTGTLTTILNGLAAFGLHKVFKDATT